MTSVNERIASRLEHHEKLDKRASEALIVGESRLAEKDFAYSLRHFVEAFFLAVLVEVKPDVAAAAWEWLEEALNDGQTPAEVAYGWRAQLAAGETLWLPHSIIEAL